MTIEVTRSSEASTAARSGAANGRAGVADAQDGSGGFMMALSAADSAATERTVTDGAAGDQARPDEQESPAKAAVQSADASNSVPAVVPDPAPAIPAVDNAMLFAQSSLVARDAAAAMAAGQSAASGSGLRPGVVPGMGSAVAAVGAAALGAVGAMPSRVAGGIPSSPAASAAKAAASSTAAAEADATTSAAENGGLAANPPVETAVGDAAHALGDEILSRAAQEPGVATLGSATEEAASAKRSLPAAASAAALAASAVNAKIAASDPAEAWTDLSAALGGKQATSRAQPGVDAPRGMSTLAFSQPLSQAAQRLAAQTEALRAPLQDPAQAQGWTMASETIVLQAAQAGPLARREDKIGDRSTGTAFSLIGAASGSTAPEASAFMLPVDAAPGAAAGGQTSLAERMVDQVTYWMSQKIQGAEIKMDVAGGQTVSVSVQIKGNEAQVAFRSDQPEVRQMLTQSMPQLEKMLGSEGLMLSGATVGGHAEGAGGQSNSREPAASLVANGPAIGPLGLAEAPRAAPQGIHARSGRSLDLYV